MRDYIQKEIVIDGRNIPYQIFTADDYLEAKYSWSDEEFEKFYEENYKAVELISEIMAVKQSFFLMRRVNYGCGTLSEALYDLKEKLIMELFIEYNLEFDEELVGNYY